MIMLPNNSLGWIAWSAATGLRLPTDQHLAHPASQADPVLARPLCGALHATLVFQIERPLLWPGLLCQTCYAQHQILCGIEA
jgi:hypothetical protein